MRKWHISAHGGSATLRGFEVALLVATSTLVAGSCASEQDDAANRVLTASGPNDAAADRSRTTSGGPKQPIDARERGDAGCFPLISSLIGGQSPSAEAATCACVVEPSDSWFASTWQDALSRALESRRRGGCQPGDCEGLGHCGSYDAEYIVGVDTATLLFYDHGSGRAVARLWDVRGQNTCAVANESFVMPTGHCIWDGVPDGQGPMAPPAQTPPDPCAGDHPAGGCPCSWPDGAWCCGVNGSGIQCNGGYGQQFYNGPCGASIGNGMPAASMPPLCDPCAWNDTEGIDLAVVGCPCHRTALNRCCDNSAGNQLACVNQVWTLEADPTCSEAPEGGPNRAHGICEQQRVSDPPYSTEPW